MALKHLRTKKLLAASIGVATVSYVACSNSETSGNLMAGDGGIEDVAQHHVDGNLMAPDVAPLDVVQPSDVVGNLMDTGPLDVAQPDADTDAEADAETDAITDAGTE